jgi:hypothetical protein
MTNLETRMYNILRKNPIVQTKGQYLAALNRLKKQGVAVKAGNEWRLSLKSSVLR